MATAAGVILALTPLVVPVVLALFVVVVWLTRYVSLGSCLAAIAAPITASLLGQQQAAELYVALALIIVVMHQANIRRLLRGEESKLSSRPRSPERSRSSSTAGRERSCRKSRSTILSPVDFWT